MTKMPLELLDDTDLEAMLLRKQDYSMTWKRCYYSKETKAVVLLEGDYNYDVKASTQIPS